MESVNVTYSLAREKVGEHISSMIHGPIASLFNCVPEVPLDHFEKACSFLDENNSIGFLVAATENQYEIGSIFRNTLRETDPYFGPIAVYYAGDWAKDESNMRWNSQILHQGYPVAVGQDEAGREKYELRELPAGTETAASVLSKCRAATSAFAFHYFYDALDLMFRVVQGRPPIDFAPTHDKQDSVDVFGQLLSNTFCSLVLRYFPL